MLVMMEQYFSFRIMCADIGRLLVSVLLMLCNALNAAIFRTGSFQVLFSFSLLI